MIPEHVPLYEIVPKPTKTPKEDLLEISFNERSQSAKRNVSFKLPENRNTSAI